MSRQTAESLLLLSWMAYNNCGHCVVHAFWLRGVAEIVWRWGLLEQYLLASVLSLPSTGLRVVVSAG